MSTLGGRRVAVLGDMLELGDRERQGHEQVGRRAAQVADRLIAVGPRGRITVQVAIAEGLPSAHVCRADDNQEALACLLDWLAPGDCVLIKGSRGMAMEEIVEKLEVVS